MLYFSNLNQFDKGIFKLENWNQLNYCGRTDKLLSRVKLFMLVQCTSRSIIWKYVMNFQSITKKLFQNQKLPSNIGVDIVICDYQKEQEHSQHIWENCQLDISDHAATKHNTQRGTKFTIISLIIISPKWNSTIIWNPYGSSTYLFQLNLFKMKK